MCLRRFSLTLFISIIPFGFFCICVFAAAYSQVPVTGACCHPSALLLCALSYRRDSARGHAAALVPFGLLHSPGAAPDTGSRPDPPPTIYAIILAMSVTKVNQKSHKMGL